MEQRSQSSRLKRSAKTSRQERKQSRNGIAAPEQQSLSAAAAQSALRYAFPGIPGEYLLAAGNQLLLNALPRSEPTAAPELHFSESAPENSFETADNAENAKNAENAEFRLPEFSGALLALNDFDGISGGI